MNKQFQACVRKFRIDFSWHRFRNRFTAESEIRFVTLYLRETQLAKAVNSISDADRYIIVMDNFFDNPEVYLEQ